MPEPVHYAGGVSTPVLALCGPGLVIRHTRDADRVTCPGCLQELAWEVAGGLWECRMPRDSPHLPHWARGAGVEGLALEVELALDPVEHLTDDSGRPCACGCGLWVSALCRRCGMVLCAECAPSHLLSAHPVGPHDG